MELRNEIAGIVSRAIMADSDNFDAYDAADRILAIPEIAEALESKGQDFPTPSDCRFGIIDRKNGGELLAAFDVPGILNAGDTITLPPFCLPKV